MFGKKENKIATPHDFKLSLGDKLKDRITGFEGICIYRSQWISNCNTYGLKSEKLKDGLPMDLNQFDEPMLSLVEEKIHEDSRSTGGPTESIRHTNRF